MSNFIKSFLSFGLATSIEKLLGFILLPLYTKYFDTVAYGVMEMVTTILTVSCIFGVLQLETSLQRYYYEYKSTRRKLLVSTVYLWTIIFSAIVSIVLSVGSSIISEVLFGSSKYANLFRIIAMQLPLINLSMLGLVLLRYERANLRFLIVIMTKVLSTLLLIYIFIIRLQMGIDGVFLSQLVALVLSTMLVTFYIRKNFVMKISPLLTQRNFKYALPQFPARVGSVALGQLNKFFMLGFLSLASIGIFSVSMKLASSIQLVNTAFIMAWFPFMNSQFKKDNNKDVFASVFPVVVGITCFCVCMISLFAIEVIEIFVDKKFYESHRYVGGLSLFFALYLIKEVIDIGPKIKENTKWLSFTFLLSVIVNVLSLYVFVKYFELIGVVIAMIITNLFLVVLSWIVSNKLYYIPFRISHFIICLGPTLAIVTASMFNSIDLINRLFISLLLLIYFGIFVFFSYKKLKSVF